MFLKDETILEEMAELVERETTHYKTDFYIHDKEMLKNYRFYQFIWSVGDYGTHFVTFPDNGMINGIMKSYSQYRHFLVDRIAGTLVEISYDDLATYAFQKSIGNDILNFPNEPFC